MGSIVGVFATSHILFSPKGAEDRAERAFQGMREIGRRVQAARPDAIVVISSEHMFNINLSLQPPFTVGVADSYVPFGEMGVPKTPFRGHRALAEDFVAAAAERGFDLAKMEELRPDHGIALPLVFANPGGQTPVVPIIVNINMTPLPQPRRCFALGRALKETIERHRPAGERVVVMGTGGLSHWVNIPGMGTVAADFDRECIQKIVAGRVEDLVDLTADEIVAKSGNGGLELVNWIMASATVPGRKGEQIYYEPIPEWLTGVGGIAMSV
jgi:aromatic ring-opening dioxygenase catalytic subunit (LigB family)